MFTLSNLLIVALVAALVGVVAAWLVSRWRAAFRQRAVAAYEAEVVRAAACARDRAREETEVVQDRLARLILEHEECSNSLAAAEARVAERDAALEAIKRESAVAIEERDREEGAPSWLDRPNGSNGGNGSKPDDLTAIRGLGQVLEHRLNRLGINRYRQLARMTPENAKWIASRIRVLGGRIQRDRWAEQARRMHQRKYDERL